MDAQTLRILAVELHERADREAHAAVTHSCGVQGYHQVRAGLLRELATQLHTRALKEATNV